MNFRLRIIKGITWGPSGFRFRIGKHMTIGRSGLLFFGRGGSMWFSRKHGPLSGDWHTFDNRFIYDWDIRKLVPTWFYNAKYKRNKPGTCAYQEIIEPKRAGKPRSAFIIN